MVHEERVIKRRLVGDVHAVDDVSVRALLSNQSIQLPHVK